MSDHLIDYAHDITDNILTAATSGLNVALFQHTDKILQGDYEVCMDESANLVITDESNSAMDNQQPILNKAAIERAYGNMDDNNQSGRCINKMATIPVLQSKTPGISMEYREESNKTLLYVRHSDEKNIVVIEDSSPDKINQVMEHDTTSETSLANINVSSGTSDLCSKFETLLGSPETAITSSEEQSNLPIASSKIKFKTKTNIFRYSSIFDHQAEATNSSNANKTVLHFKTDIIDQKRKVAKAVCDNRESNKRDEYIEHWSRNNLANPLGIGGKRTILGLKKAHDLNADCVSKPVSSKNVPPALKSQSRKRKHEVHGLQSASAVNTSNFDQLNSNAVGFFNRKTAEDIQTDCKSNDSSKQSASAVNTSNFDQLNSNAFDFFNRKTDEDIQTDCKSNDSRDKSPEEAFKNVKRERRIPEFISKSSVKRRCDSQTKIPNVKYRRRCRSTRDSEIGEGRESKHHVRFISADGKNCNVDRGIGQAGCSMDDLEILQTRKRKVDKGSMALIKDFSFNTKRFKQNEKAVSEKIGREKSSTSNEDSN